MNPLINSISVVIPVYKSTGTLVSLTNRLPPVLASLCQAYEIIFVDDSGNNESWETLRKLHEAHPFVSVYQLSRNYGQHNATLCGMNAAKGDIIITMDDDLQHPPEVLPNLIAALKEDIDVVYGYPMVSNHNFFRTLASTLTKMVLSRVMGSDNARHVSALRAIRRAILQPLVEYKSPLVNIDVMLTWVTSSFTYTRVEHQERDTGSTGYSFSMLVKHGLNLITGFSSLPLQIASITGFVFAGFGICVLAYVVIGWLIEGSAVPGFTFLASIVSIFAGIQLLALGIMGEYVSRIFDRISERPKYFIRQKLSR